MNKGYISLALVVVLFLIPACGGNGESKKPANGKASQRTMKKAHPAAKKASTTKTNKH